MLRPVPSMRSEGLTVFEEERRAALEEPVPPPALADW